MGRAAAAAAWPTVELILASCPAAELTNSGANTNDIAELVSVLDTLERGIDERVPDARSFVRLGLDVPVA